MISAEPVRVVPCGDEELRGSDRAHTRSGNECRVRVLSEGLKLLVESIDLGVDVSVSACECAECDYDALMLGVRADIKVGKPCNECYIGGITEPFPQKRGCGDEQDQPRSGRRIIHKARSQSDVESDPNEAITSINVRRRWHDRSMTTNETRHAALTLLHQLTGRDDAVFHEGQFEAISALVDERRRALVVQRTGWGKSAVYFIATALLRARGSGPTLLVSPLLALMRDQVAAAERAGVRAAAINSSTAEEWEEIEARLRADDIDVLLVSPERLNNPRFRESQLPDLVARMGLLVIDEAHCISDWGHDFRPDYRRIGTLLSELRRKIPVLATTATANARVVDDVSEQLGTDVLTLRGGLARDTLRLGCLWLPNNEQRLAWLTAHLNELSGSGIVYTLTVSAAEDTAQALRDAGIEVAAYTGRTDPEERERLEAALKANEVKALVATSALGMGFDKPDLGFVVHLGAPSSPVAYYQQIGRAGRGAKNADVLLLPGPEDGAIWQYFATASMPDPQRAAAVLDALERSAGTPLSTPALEAQVDVRRTQLELLLKVLDVDGAVRRVTGGWVSTGVPWHYDANRYTHIAQMRALEQQAMIDYCSGERCRMELLQAQLDDPTAAPCGRCDVCAGEWFSREVPAAAAQAAARRLQQTGVSIDARASWPSGVARRGVPVKGRIPVEERESCRV